MDQIIEQALEDRVIENVKTRNRMRGITAAIWQHGEEEIAALSRCLHIKSDASGLQPGVVARRYSGDCTA